MTLREASAFVARWTQPNISSDPIALISSFLNGEGTIHDVIATEQQLPERSRHIASRNAFEGVDLKIQKKANSVVVII